MSEIRPQNGEKMIVTPEQWQKIDDKYGNLIWKISYKISGDNAIANLEDNHSDLQVAALDAIEGFKNNKGSKIAKKYHLTRDTVSSSEYEDIIQECENDSRGQFYNFDAIECFPFKLTPLEAEVVDLVVTEPIMLKDNGTLNLSEISKAMHKTWSDVRDIVEGLSQRMQNEL